MQNKLMVIVGLLVLIGIGGFFAYAKMTPTPVQDTNVPTNETPYTPTTGAKINIEAVCQGALAYMSFPSSTEADIFVRDCIAGNHPEVIEKYKADNNLDGAAI